MNLSVYADINNRIRRVSETSSVSVDDHIKSYLECWGESSSSQLLWIKDVSGKTLVTMMTDYLDNSKVHVCYCDGRYEEFAVIGKVDENGSYLYSLPILLSHRSGSYSYTVHAKFRDGLPAAASS